MSQALIDLFARLVRSGSGAWNIYLPSGDVYEVRIRRHGPRVVETSGETIERSRS